MWRACFLFYCSVFHCWILRSCPGRSQLDIRNAERLFLFHNDSGQRYPNCPQLPRWDILSTVMRASPCLTVTERAGDGGLYRALEFCSVLSQADVSVHPASYTPRHWRMDAQTNRRQHALDKVWALVFHIKGPLIGMNTSVDPVFTRSRAPFPHPIRFSVTLLPLDGITVKIFGPVFYYVPLVSSSSTLLWAWTPKQCFYFYITSIILFRLLFLSLVSLWMLFFPFITIAGSITTLSSAPIWQDSETSLTEIVFTSW